MSDFELLIDKIQELIKEDGAAGGAVGGAVGGDATPGMVPAQTASGNPSVSYLPGEFAANKKRKKNKKFIFKRKNKVEEARSEDIHGLYNNLTRALTIDLRDNPQIKKTLILMNYWLTTFKNSRFLPMSGQVAVQLNMYDKSIKNLVNRMQKIYTDDIGNIQMIIKTIQDDRPLNAYEPFAEYDYLVGCRIQSEYEGVILILELTVNMGIVATQSMYIESQDTLDELGSYRTVKVLKDMVFPVGEMFTPSIFNNIKAIIDDIEEEEIKVSSTKKRRIEK